MSISLADRIKEISYSVGTGDFILGGAFAGFSDFASSYSYGDIVYYAITDGASYEIGSGEYLFSSPNKILRRYPFKSTNNNNKINFGAGIKEVYVTYPGQKSVFTAGNFGTFSTPQNSGVAFWRTPQIVDYDSLFVWDAANNRLGVNTSNPQHAIDVGGQNSRLRVSGIIVGASGITFPQQDLLFSGGLQREPFLRNQTDATTRTSDVFAMSGLVGERLTFKQQSPKYFLGGPVSGIIDAYPTFRPLYINDIPDLSSLYILKSEIGTSGQVAFYEGQGFGFDPAFVWDKNNNYLAINKTIPTQSLDVNGNGLFAGYVDVRNYISTISGVVTSGSIFFANGNTAPVGVLNWDNGEGTLALGMKGGNVTLNLGQKNVVLSYNGVGSTLNKGQVVYVSGAQGQRPRVNLAMANNELTAARTFGIADENISAGSEGFIATYGIVRGINTSALIEGSGIWLSATTPGAITMTRPIPPNHGVFLGWCIRSHASVGQIFVDVQNGHELEELHDVLIQNLASGDSIVYDSSIGAWRNRNSIYTAGSGLTLVGYQFNTAGTGNFSQIIFGPTSGNIAIGINTPTNNRYAVAIGYGAGIASTGNANNFIGFLAGSGLIADSANVFLGYGAGVASSGGGSVYIGPNAGNLGYGTSNIAIGPNAGGFVNNNIWGENINIGNAAGFASNSFYYGVNIGRLCGLESSGHSNVNIGATAGYRSTGIANCYIGFNDGYECSGSYNIGIGLYSFFKSSGNYNIAMGNNAFVASNGDNNIFIGNLLVNRKTYNYSLNIGDVIGGNISSKRLYIGEVDTSLSPNATLDIRPRIATDPVLIVNAKSLQSADLQRWNNEFGTKITFVDSGGIINANSGIILTLGTPTNTSNRLYNVGGALHFNGSALAGGYSSWTIADSGGNSEAVTNATQITFSGANGIATTYNTSTNVMLISGINIGGGGYTSWRIADSGGNFEDVTNATQITFSGANNISTTYNPATNIMLISGATPASYTWNIANSGSSAFAVNTNNTITFSGAFGVNTGYNDTTKVLSVNGSGLSGVLSNFITSVSGWSRSYTDTGFAASGYTGWNIANSGGASFNIANTNTVTFSGAFGVNTGYNNSTRVLSVNGSDLSGVLSNFATSVANAASGWARSYADTGFSASGYTGWTLADSGGNSGNIARTNIVTFSGVNGISTIYNSTTRVMAVSGNYTAGSGIIITGNQIALSGGLISASGFASTAYIQTSGAFVTENASFVLASGHNGKTILSSGVSQINVTVSGNLPLGFGVAFIQTGPGAIFYSGAPGVDIRNRQGHTRSNGTWAATSLVQFSQNNFILAGDTTT